MRLIIRPTMQKCFDSTSSFSFTLYMSDLQSQPPSVIEEHQARKKYVWEDSDDDTSNEEWRPSGPKGKQSSSPGRIHYVLSGNGFYETFRLQLLDL